MQRTFLLRAIDEKLHYELEMADVDLMFKLHYTVEVDLS